MYLAGLLNQEGLFTATAGWPQIGSDDYSRDDFLFRASSAALHMARLRELQRICVEEYGRFAGDLDIRRRRIVISSATVVQLVDEVPPLLGTLRIMQNMLLPMCARALSLKSSVPGSLHAAVKTLHRYGFPPSLVARTLQYWETGGRLLKEFRDLDQHHHVIVKHVLLEVEPAPRVRVFLPDNPSEKRASGFTFAAERDALEYLPDAFRHLHDFAESLASQVGAVARPVDQRVQLSQLGVLLPAMGGTIALLLDVASGVAGIAATEISQLEDGRLSLRLIPQVAKGR